MSLLLSEYPQTNKRTFDKLYDVSFEVRPRYLYVKVRSLTISYEIARAYWNEILVMVSRLGLKYILVDKDISAALSAGDAFQIASEVAMEFRLAKLAICDRHATAEGIEFGELVATNRGLNTRSFADIDNAETWLLGGSDLRPDSRLPHAVKLTTGIAYPIVRPILPVAV